MKSEHRDPKQNLKSTSSAYFKRKPADQRERPRQSSYVDAKARQHFSTVDNETGKKLQQRTSSQDDAKRILKLIKKYEKLNRDQARRSSEGKNGSKIDKLQQSFSSGPKIGSNRDAKSGSRLSNSNRHHHGSSKGQSSSTHEKWAKSALSQPRIVSEAQGGPRPRGPPQRMYEERPSYKQERLSREKPSQLQARVINQSKNGSKNSTLRREGSAFRKSRTISPIHQSFDQRNDLAPVLNSSLRQPVGFMHHASTSANGGNQGKRGKHHHQRKNSSGQSNPSDSLNLQINNTGFFPSHQKKQRQQKQLKGRVLSGDREDDPGMNEVVGHEGGAQNVTQVLSSIEYVDHNNTSTGKNLMNVAKHLNSSGDTHSNFKRTHQHLQGRYHSPDPQARASGSLGSGGGYYQQKKLYTPQSRSSMTQEQLHMISNSQSIGRFHQMREQARSGVPEGSRQHTEEHPLNDTLEIDRNYQQLRHDLRKKKSSVPSSNEILKQPPHNSEVTLNSQSHRSNIPRPNMGVYHGKVSRHSSTSRKNQIGITRGIQVKASPQPVRYENYDDALMYNPAIPTETDGTDQFQKQLYQDGEQLQNGLVLECEEPIQISSSPYREMPMQMHSGNRSSPGVRNHEASRCSYRSKSLDLNYERRKASSGLSNNTSKHHRQSSHYGGSRYNNGNVQYLNQSDVLLNFNDSSVQKVNQTTGSPSNYPHAYNMPMRMRSSSPKHPIGHRAFDDLNNAQLQTESKSEKLADSPRFSQVKEQMHSSHSRRGMYRHDSQQRSRNEQQLMTQMVNQQHHFPHDTRSPPKPRAVHLVGSEYAPHMEQEHNSPPEVQNSNGFQNMNFNTQDLIQMTCPADAPGVTGSDQQYFYGGSIQPIDSMHNMDSLHMQGSSNCTVPMDGNQGPIMYQSQSYPLKYHQQHGSSVTRTETIGGGQGHLASSAGLGSATHDTRGQRDYPGIQQDGGMMQASINDDTFRGENFIQQSVREGLGSLGTTGSLHSSTGHALNSQFQQPGQGPPHPALQHQQPPLPMKKKNLLPPAAPPQVQKPFQNLPPPSSSNRSKSSFIQRAFQTYDQAQSSYPVVAQIPSNNPASPNNLTMNDLGNSQSNAMKALTTTTGVNGIYTGTGTVETGTVQDESTTLAGTGSHQLSKILQQQKTSPFQVNSPDDLYHRLQESRFSSFVEKAWMKARLRTIHQTLNQASSNMLHLNIAGAANSKRMDSYYASLCQPAPDYSNLNQVDLVKMIEEVSKKYLQESIQQLNNTMNISGQQFSRCGLSRLSEIDSNFQISKISPRGAAAQQFTHQQQMQLIEQQSMTSGNAPTSNNIFQTKGTKVAFHPNQVVNPSNQNINTSINSPFHTLNKNESSSTFDELEQADQKKSDESDIIINKLRRTIADMAKKMKQLELSQSQKLAGDDDGASELLKKGDFTDYHNTPSLANISPRCKSELNEERDTKQNIVFLQSQLQHKDLKTKDLQKQVDQHLSEIGDLQTDFAKETRSLKDKFREKFDEQNQFISELRTELNQTHQKNDNYEKMVQTQQTQIKRQKEDLEQKYQDGITLENQVQSLNRQIQMYKNQAQCDKKTIETNQIRLQSSKDQEKHWKCGYETIFAKYTKLKELAQKRDDEFSRMEKDMEFKIKDITRNAEDAITYFKNVALGRVQDEEKENIQTRANRFQPKSQASHYLNNPLRSKSAHSSNDPARTDLKNKGGPSLRIGNVTPTRTTLQTYSAHKKDRLSSQYRQEDRTSFSPVRDRIHPAKLTIRRTDTIDEDHMNQMSPIAKKRLSLIDKIQNQLAKRNPSDTNERQRQDQNLQMALEALAAAFEEIAEFKKSILDLSTRYYSKNCDQLQDFQVLSYDYLDQIEKHHERESNLMTELEEKSKQIQDLKFMVNQFKEVIEEKETHMARQKALKEQQWKNIIQYDLAKDTEKKNIKEEVFSESVILRQLIKNLHQEIQDRDHTIDNKNEEIEVKEQDRVMVENALNQLRKEYESLSNDLDDSRAFNTSLEEKQKHLEMLIKDCLVISLPSTAESGASSVAEPNANLSQAMNHIHSPSMTQSMVAAATALPTGPVASNILSNQVSNLFSINGQQQQAPTTNQATGLATMDQPSLKDIPQALGRETFGQDEVVGGKIQSQEIVLHNQNKSEIYTNTNSSKSLPGAGQQQHQQPNQILSDLSAPAMPIDWLGKIKASIISQHKKIADYQQYFDSLSGILASHNLTMEDTQLKDIQSLSLLSEEDILSIQHLHAGDHDPLGASGNMPIAFHGTGDGNQSEHEDFEQFAQQQPMVGDGQVYSNQQSNLSSQNQTPRHDSNMFIQQNQFKTMNYSKYQNTFHDNALSQSLESFMNKNDGESHLKPISEEPVPAMAGGAGNGDQSLVKGAPATQSQDLHNFAASTLPCQMPLRRLGQTSKTPTQANVFSINPKTDFQKAAGLDTFDGTRMSLPRRIEQLINANKIRSKTIISMNTELENVKRNRDEQIQYSQQEILNLQSQMASLEAEKDQLDQIYAQENKMRQELEEQLQESKTRAGDANFQISQFEEDLERLQEQIEREGVEKQKLEQSNEYWQNSFKLIEKHYLEEKERSDHEIQNLMKQVGLQEDDIVQKQIQIDHLDQENSTLKEEWLPIKEAMDTAEAAEAQTDLTVFDLGKMEERVGLLDMENDQVKRDIQVLIDSYENFKSENSKIQENLREKISKLSHKKEDQLKKLELEKQLIIDRLNSEVQEQITIKQQKDDLLSANYERIEELEGSVGALEKQKEDYELQVIQQKDQLDQLQQFASVIQTYNQQLQDQLNSALQNPSCNTRAHLSEPMNIAPTSHSQFSPQQHTQMSPKYLANQNELFSNRSGQPYAQQHLPTDVMNPNVQSQSIGQFANKSHQPRSLGNMNGDGQTESQVLQMNYMAQIEGQQQRAPNDQFEATQVLGTESIPQQEQIPYAGDTLGYAGPTQDQAAQQYSHPLRYPQINQQSYNSNQQMLNSLSGSQQTLMIQANYDQQKYEQLRQAKENDFYAPPQRQSTKTQQSHQDLNHNHPNQISHSQIGGLDMCQNCIAYEGQIQADTSIIKKLIQSYIHQVRKLSNMCMEGALLLRIQDKQAKAEIQVKETCLVRKAGRDQKNSSSTSDMQETSSFNTSQQNLQQNEMSEAEKKTALIRQAQKFLDKDIEKFINGSSVQRKREKLFRYGSEMINIAQAIVQNSCEATISYYQSQQNLKNVYGNCGGDSSSLKIQDYQSCDSQRLGSSDQLLQHPQPRNPFRTIQTINKGCQTRGEDDSALASHLTGGLVTPAEFKESESEIMALHEQLGTSIDSKISTLVKLLLSLKNIQKALRKDDSLTKIITQVSNSVSKMVHELTQDTEMLSDLTSKIKDLLQGGVDGGRSYNHQLLDLPSKKHLKSKTSRVHFNQSQSQSISAAASDLDMPFSQNVSINRNGILTSKNQKKEHIMNFISEDGRTVTGQSNKSANVKASQKNLLFAQKKHSSTGTMGQPSLKLSKNSENVSYAESNQKRYHRAGGRSSDPYQLADIHPADEDEELYDDQLDISQTETSQMLQSRTSSRVNKKGSSNHPTTTENVTNSTRNMGNTFNRNEFTGGNEITDRFHENDYVISEEQDDAHSSSKEEPARGGTSHHFNPHADETAEFKRPTPEPVRNEYTDFLLGDPRSAEETEEEEEPRVPPQLAERPRNSFKQTARTKKTEPISKVSSKVQTAHGSRPVSKPHSKERTNRSHIKVQGEPRVSESVNESQGVENLVDDMSALMKRQQPQLQRQDSLSPRTYLNQEGLPNANLQNFDSIPPTPGLPPQTAASGYFEEEGEYGQQLGSNQRYQTLDASRSHASGLGKKNLGKTQVLPAPMGVMSEGGEDLDEILEKQSLKQKLQQNKDILKVIQEQQLYIQTLSSNKSGRKPAMKKQSSRSLQKEKNSQKFGSENTTDGISQLQTLDPRSNYVQAFPNDNFKPKKSSHTHKFNPKSSNDSRSFNNRMDPSGVNSDHMNTTLIPHPASLEFSRTIEHPDQVPQKVEKFSKKHQISVQDSGVFQPNTSHHERSLNNSIDNPQMAHYRQQKTLADRFKDRFEVRLQVLDQKLNRDKSQSVERKSSEGYRPSSKSRAYASADNFASNFARSKSFSGGSDTVGSKSRTSQDKLSKKSGAGLKRQQQHQSSKLSSQHQQYQPTNEQIKNYLEQLGRSEKENSSQYFEQHRA